MKTYELEPTKMNIKDTFLKDSISRDEDIIRFCEILNAAPDGCSVALDGKWGSGKTFFIKQTKMILDVFNDNYVFDDSDNVEEDIATDDQEQIKQQCLKINDSFSISSCASVYFDAWENDNDEDPILSLIYSIVEELHISYPSVLEDKKLADKTALIIEAAMQLVTDRDWKSIVDNLKGSDPFSQMKESKKLEECIRDFFDELPNERGNKFIVFIDELDRCKPSYAVQMLERIKHYFSSSRVVFVFSTNIDQLLHTIKRFYGDNFDACRYIDRFFDLQITIPQLNLQKYYHFLDIGQHSTIDIICESVINILHMEMREINRFLSITNIAITTSFNSKNYNNQMGQSLLMCVRYFTPVMIGLKMTDNDRYKKFIDGQEQTLMSEIIADSDIEPRGFYYLFDNNKAFEDWQTDETKGELENKFREIYEVVFSPSPKEVTKRIGTYTYSSLMKDTLLQVVSSLSIFTNIG